jgi:hypothetical protein
MPKRKDPLTRAFDQILKDQFKKPKSQPKPKTPKTPKPTKD